MVGVMTSREALAIAEQRGLDLLEDRSNGDSSYLQNHGLRQVEVREQEEGKRSEEKQTVITVKEIQVRPRTDDHDIDVKVRHARRLLARRRQSKSELTFHGTRTCAPRIRYGYFEARSRTCSWM